MTYISWDDDIYSLGIKKINDQHKYLVSLINAIAMLRATPDREYLDKVLNTLVQYTNEHFKDEERMLSRTRFSGTREHHDMHLEFSRKIKEWSEDFHAHQDSKIILEQILSHLREWLTHHILIEDKKYAHFLLD